MKAMASFFQVIVLLSVPMVAKSQSPATAIRTPPIGVGDVAPDFTLTDHNGNKVTLSDAKGKTPVVLVFYRGYW